MDSTTNNIVNQAKPANNSTVSGNIPAIPAIPAVKPNYPDISLKDVISKPEVQEALRRYAFAPDVVTIKKLRNAFENKETNTTTQKIKALGGATVEEAVEYELTLLNTKLDPVEAVNKKYRIVDYMFGLEANMSGGKFGGYAAKGLKLMVTKLEEVK